ncbi:hypothetical protein HOE22_08030 [Candidatus Woesearchaeota archaeon]|jgi:hypothetical protein|nr:hypothetical protein [Candidatus Woesearchaeota archaeon]MBT4731500.1 hypothetical protein [Candidatus Woesearchaeota archaeon]MBT4935829.1 hypothetical protein [Candidatus Woesearchaeota archaeon]MBT5759644.1 hypothetical protein [Candidatus Neomarinimicrobiota bacterium]
MNKTTKRELLTKVFDWFADRSDWRSPINTNISFAIMVNNGWSKDLINEAIEFFTATTPTWIPVRDNGYYDVEWNVKSHGYRMGPAGS